MTPSTDKANYEVAGVCCAIDPELNTQNIYQATRYKLSKAKTKQDRVEALADFASFHGLFSDEPELRKRVIEG